MAWNQWPPVVNVSKRRQFWWIRQLIEGIRERQWCFNNVTIFPRTNQVWDSGTITSLVDNGDGTWTITDSGKLPAPTGPGTQPDNGYYWNGGRIFPACCGQNHWVGVDCRTCPPDGMPYIPALFDLIIQHDNGAIEWYRDQQPWAIVRGNIVGSTSQTLKVQVKLQNYVTAKAIPSTSALVGSRYYIIKTGGLWWADKDFLFGRYPDWPNHRELWRGDADAGGKFFTDNTGYLTELTNKVLRSPYDDKTPSPNTWVINQWAGKEVLVYDGDGNLRRLVATGNDRDHIFFGGLTVAPPPGEGTTLQIAYTIAGRFTIVPPGSRGWPERKPWRTDWFYGGAFDTVVTHDPTDALVARTLAFAADSRQWRELEDLTLFSCEQDEAIRTESNALDKDIWTSLTNMCAPADFCFSPHLFKSFRHIQVSLESMIPNFIRPVLPTPTPGQTVPALPEIRSYSMAQCFLDCGINAGTAVVQRVTDGAGNRIYFFVVDDAYKGQSIYWDAIAAASGKRKGTGLTPADVSSGRVVVFTVAAASVPADDGTWLNATVAYTAGWTRWHRRAFTHLYERGAFIPDVKTVDGAPVLVYPAAVDDFCGEGGEEECAKDCFGVGRWIWREASSGYKTYTDHGYAQEGINQFAATHAARYEGDAWLDPGTGVTRETDEDLTDLPYWDRFFEGTHSAAVEAVLRGQRSGVVTRGNAFSMQDTTQNWWQHWYTTNNGTMRTESGIATGGSTTTLVTTPSLTDVDDAAHCFWQQSRFSGSLFLKSGAIKPYLNFILEVDKLEQLVADGGEPRYAGDGTDTIVGTYNAGDLVEDINGDPLNVTWIYKMPITDVTAIAAGQTPVLHFAARKTRKGDADLVIAAGDTWRIKEPATNLHYWRGKRIRFTRPDGTKLELDITHNDNDTIFFAAQTDANNIPKRFWTYEFIEHETGGVWVWQTTEPTPAEKLVRRWQRVTYTYVDGASVTQTVTGYWVQPVGVDARKDVSATWRSTMQQNLAKLLPKMYGRQLKGDTIGIHLFDEAYKVMNRLVWTVRALSWTSRANAAVAELNTTGGSQLAELNAPVNDANLAAWSATGRSSAEAAYAAGTTYPGGVVEFPQEQDGVAPGAGANWSAELNTGADFMSGPWALGASYAYGQVTGIPNLIAHKTVMYGYAAIASGDPDPYTNVDGDSLEFDAQGSPFEFRSFVEFYASPISKNAADKSGKIGELATPDWPEDIVTADLVGGKINYARSVGYAVIDQKAVIKWNVAGGLRYVDWTAS